MKNASGPAWRGWQITLLALALVVLFGLLAVSGHNIRANYTVTAANANSPILAQISKPNETPTALKLMKVEPVKGYAGDSITVTGDGFPPGKQVDFFWSTVDGAYATKVIPDNVEYHERRYEEKRIRMGGMAADPQGRVNMVLRVPEDFGESMTSTPRWRVGTWVGEAFGFCAARPSIPPKALSERRSPSQ
jgi:hypothetical protein